MMAHPPSHALFPGLRAPFSSSIAMRHGIITILEEGNPHLRKGGVVMPLQQREEDSGLISFEVEIDANSEASSPGIAKRLTLGVTGSSSPRDTGTSSSGVRLASSPSIGDHRAWGRWSSSTRDRRNIIARDHVMIIIIWDHWSTRVFLGR